MVLQPFLRPPLAYTESLFSSAFLRADTLPYPAKIVTLSKISETREDFGQPEIYLVMAGDQLFSTANLVAASHSRQARLGGY